LAEPTTLSSTDLALDRTRLAHDRTLMAWVRTATSLISFGFTIYKFFQYLREKGEPEQKRLFGPREFATVMIGIGLVSLILATIQNRSELAALRKQYPNMPHSIAVWVAGMVGVLGLAAMLAVIFRQ
jgi:putative membrane protein